MPYDKINNKYAYSQKKRIYFLGILKYATTNLLGREVVPDFPCCGKNDAKM